MKVGGNDRVRRQDQPTASWFVEGEWGEEGGGGTVFGSKTLSNV